MRFAHLILDPASAPELVVVQEERFVPVRALGGDAATLQQLIAAGPEALDAVRSAAAQLPNEQWQELAGVTYGPAVIMPPIVLAVGLNYDEHASELSLDNDSGPVLFSLFPNSLGAHEGEVPIPVEISEEVDYEGELGVIIGRPAKNVTPEEALDYVFGYTTINDITARNIQFQEPQWSRCKSFDGFTPIGPVVVTADEIPDPQALAITTDVDGLRVQDSTTEFMVRTVAQLISSISQSLTLLPGTVISTGSPGGAGRSRKPPLYLKPGTEVTVTIENVGTLTSHCVRAEMPGH
ncbi:fumarylacetoacetate hydrolase family protein [Leucobacter sp. PH1c]|uniref:fumarylacetoacetate hydrolase family protein n=1 Tax=Leucobacter sp. PH1c TaxID=1397278 RepID=UPI000469A7DE|nr:fumarylacetoacetate hydrolase family protein [Leucobacter sp. PH1c]